MRLAASAVFTTLLISVSGFCGDIHGRIQRSNPQDGSTLRAVVWLADAPKTELPATKLVMSQRKGKFTPDFMIVTAGQTVAMPNLDDVAHNVYSTSAAKTFNLGFYAKGDYRVVTFPEAGLVEIGCRIHQAMHAIVMVVPNSYYAVVDNDGSFQLKNVPKGTYTLKFWGEGLSSESRSITVGSGESVEVNFEGNPSRADEASKVNGH